MTFARFFNRINILFHKINFNLRKKTLGFENANKLLRIVDKNVVLKLLKLDGAIIGDKCIIESPLIVHNCSNYRNLTVEDNVYIGKNCFLDLRDKIIIKKNVTISNDCKIITHMDVGQSIIKKIYPKSQDKVIINENSYIGANTTILMGVEIGEKCLVAAGSVVITNTPANLLVAGIPAKTIKKIIL